MSHKLMVKLTNTFPSENILRQTPGEAGIWGDCKFIVNEQIPQCDYWVIFEGLLKSETTTCPPENVIFITGEPPDLRSYPKKFLDQFSTVITCHNMIKHPHVVLRPQSHPWHVGWNKASDNASDCLTYDKFKAMQPVSKSKLISVVTSAQSLLPGHKRRLLFLDKLRNHFGSQIDIFGRGIRPIDDKWDAIAPYKYHIALENAAVDNWLTEKITDAYLGFTFPLYYGAPNVFEYFPEKSLQLLDINNWQDSIRLLENIINNNTYETALSSIIEAREAVLDKYNLFAMLSDLITKDRIGKPKQQITLLPEANFPELYVTMKRKLSRIPGHLKYLIQKNTNRVKF